MKPLARFTIALTTATALATVVVPAGPAIASGDQAEMSGNLPPSAQLGVPNTPSGFQARALPLETSPAQCPRRAPRRTILVRGKARDLCVAAVRGAATPYAKRAIRYAFAHLGAPYATKGIGRDSTSPYIFDCSSLIGRAFDAGGAVVRSTALGYSVPFYPLFSYTGAYVPGNFRDTNVVRIRRSQLRPGDFSIQFNGATPINSGGANGHAQLYLGNGVVAQSTPAGPGGLSVWRAHNGFSNAWYFRVTKTHANPPASLVPDTGAVFLSSAAVLGSTDATSVTALQTALLATSFATPELRTSGAIGVYTQATADSVLLLQTSMGYPQTAITGLLDPYSAAKLGLTFATG